MPLVEDRSRLSSLVSARAARFSQQSRAAYYKAIGPAGNTAETAYLTRRRDQLR